MDGDEEEVAQGVMRSEQDADASGIADHRRADLQQFYPDGCYTCPGQIGVRQIQLSSDRR